MLIKTDDLKSLRPVTEIGHKLIYVFGSSLPTQANGRIIKESLLMGPYGGLKMHSIWEGNKLITIELFG